MIKRVDEFLPQLFEGISPLVLYAAETILEEIFSTIFGNLYQGEPEAAAAALWMQQKGKSRAEDFLQSKAREEDEEWIKVYGAVTIYIFGNAFTILGASFGTLGLRVTVLGVEVWPTFDQNQLVEKAQEAAEKTAAELENRSGLNKLRSNGIIGSSSHPLHCVPLVCLLIFLLLGLRCRRWWASAVRHGSTLLGRSPRRLLQLTCRRTGRLRWRHLKICRGKVQRPRQQICCQKRLTAQSLAIGITQ